MCTLYMSIYTHITYMCTVRGLESFGVKLPDACKVFKKKFSTGASVTETPDQKEEIEIQV